jgi:hypothetical protein
VKIDLPQLHDPVAAFSMAAPNQGVNQMSTEQILILFVGGAVWILWRIYLEVKSIRFIMLLTDQAREQVQKEEDEERWDLS